MMGSVIFKDGSSIQGSSMTIDSKDIYSFISQIDLEPII